MTSRTMCEVIKANVVGFHGRKARRLRVKCMAAWQHYWMLIGLEEYNYFSKQTMAEILAGVEYDWKVKKLGKFLTKLGQKLWWSKLKSDRYLYILGKSVLKDKNLMCIVLDEDIQNSVPKTWNKPYYLLISKSNPIWI